MTEFEIEQIRRNVFRKYKASGVSKSANAVNELLETSSKMTAEIISQCLQHCSQAPDESPRKDET